MANILGSLDETVEARRRREIEQDKLIKLEGIRPFDEILREIELEGLEESQSAESNGGSLQAGSTEVAAIGSEAEVEPVADDLLQPSGTGSVVEIAQEFDEPSDDAEEAGDGQERDERVPVEFLTGVAGSGKSYTIMQRRAADPNHSILAATTGIAAINLNATTINGLLKFFNTESLQDAYRTGRLTRILRDISRTKVKYIVIDEVSMMHALQLDIIYSALKDVAEYDDVKREHPLGLILTGDFCQLPPVPDKDPLTLRNLPTPWAFNADCWPEFERNTTILRKVWRQSNATFLDALNSIRSGDGVRGAALLQQAGVDFASYSNIDFPGTTLVATNPEVARANSLALMKLSGKPFSLTSRRWTKTSKRDGSPAYPGEWKNIDEEAQYKIGAYVMILANDSPKFTFCNGDCGWIEDFDEKAVAVKLARNGETVSIGRITRYQQVKDHPDGKDVKADGFDVPILTKKDRKLGYRPEQVMPWGKVFYDEDPGKFSVGAVEYFPLRLAYATTVHKSQGLSLDKVQIDPRHNFFGAPAMMYTALSRCRSPEGLRIVGNPDLIAKRTSVAEEVRRWL